jgi:hypothetical protein
VLELQLAEQSVDALQSQMVLVLQLVQLLVEQSVDALQSQTALV